MRIYMRVLLSRANFEPVKMECLENGGKGEGPEMILNEKEKEKEVEGEKEEEYISVRV